MLLLVIVLQEKGQDYNKRREDKFLLYNDIATFGRVTELYFFFQGNKSNKRKVLILYNDIAGNNT